MTLTHYPGKTDVETIRSFLGDGPERVKFEKVLGENCGPGNPTGANQHMPEERGNDDNVVDSSQAAKKGNTLGYAI